MAAAHCLASSLACLTRSLWNQMFLRTSMSFLRFDSFCLASSFSSMECSRSIMLGDLQQLAGAALVAGA